MQMYLIFTKLIEKREDVREIREVDCRKIAGTTKEISRKVSRPAETRTTGIHNRDPSDRVSAGR